MYVETHSNRTKRVSKFHDVSEVEHIHGEIRIVHGDKVTLLGDFEHRIKKVLRESDEQSVTVSFPGL
jgi:hypothetical protein